MSDQIIVDPPKRQPLDIMASVGTYIADQGISGDRKPIYNHLAYIYKKFVERHPVSETENIKTLSGLLGGLTDYFTYANRTQSELIEISALAARKTLMAEILLVGLDQNSNVTDSVSLSQEIEKVMPGERIPEVPEKLLEKVKATWQAEDEAKHKASQDLRGEIQAWVRGFENPYIENYNECIDSFNEARTQMARDLNVYENDLSVLQSSLEKMQRPAVYRAKNTFLLSEVAKRMKAVEAFRNGIIRELPPQGKTLEEEHITDISEESRNMNIPAHPLVERLWIMQDRLHSLTKDCPNPLYREDSPDMPEFRVLESGIKSPMRTIDKLVHEKACRWEAMPDICRFGIAFSNVHDMFYYAGILNDTANSKQWNIHEDKGMKMARSGSMNWHIRMKTPPGTWPQVVEVKLYDLQQHNVELVSHKLYECIRMVESSDRQIDLDNMTPEHYQEFCHHTHTTVMGLLAHPKLFAHVPQLQSLLQGIASLAGTPEYTNSDDIPGCTIKLHALLDKAHMVNCASAARSSSHRMAALNAFAFSELKASMKKASQSTETLEKVYEIFGPSKGVHYFIPDLEDVKSLVSSHRKVDRNMQNGNGRAT